MAKAPAVKKAPIKKAAVKTAVTKKSGRPYNAAQEIAQ